MEVTQVVEVNQWCLKVLAILEDKVMAAAKAIDEDHLLPQGLSPGLRFCRYLGAFIIDNKVVFGIGVVCNCAKMYPIFLPTFVGGHGCCKQEEV